MTPRNCFREYEKKIQGEEKCLKRTKPTLTSASSITRSTQT